ncbi:MAG: selenocysteine-specific translation elongation factor, partial [Verrucomicrobia bacterium]|nr:selenocysteine-specific translation elongation factor [Verrucomicrobiota bacterium]
MSGRPPGLLRADVQPDVVSMLCTAGHVDHGKTSLVKTLTGCATDRLKEEIERGLTIELGFAPCWIGGDLCVGIVDVPGHERFVRTMVAGVSGIDTCILVIAADDGIMPQTREHVEIMQLMGMTKGMVALTKIDLVTPADVETRTAEIREFLETTFLRGAPICPLSTITGDGFGPFYDTLVASLKAGLRDRRTGIFRLPVERAFSRPGFGAVATGIPVAGTIRLGTEVECVPGGSRGHIRGLQRFGRTAEEGGAGQCLALNIPEYGKSPPVRGQVLCPPGYLQAGLQFHARLHAAPRLDPPLANAEEVTFHTGTAEQHGRVYLLESKRLGAGESQLATLAIAEPVAAAAGDRFIVRRVSPQMTVGGGRVLRVDAAPRRPRRKLLLIVLQQHEDFLAGVEWDSDAGRQRRIEHLLRRDEPPALTPGEIGRRTLMTGEAVIAALGALTAAGIVKEIGGGTVACTDRVDTIRDRLEKRLSELAAASDRLRVPLAEWRRGFEGPAALWDHCCREIERSGRARVAGGFAMPAAGLDTLSAADRTLAEQMLAIYEREKFETTHPDEVHGKLGAPADRTARMLEWLTARGDLVRVAPNVVLTATHLRAAQDHVVRTIQAA